MRGRSWFGVLKMTEGEYRANISGMNVVFGAVLGVVMGRLDTLPPADFAALLFVAASVVVVILYVGSSPHHILYALLAAGCIAALPWAYGRLLGPGREPPELLQATLAVWLAMLVLVELLYRPPFVRRAAAGENAETPPAGP